jgi:excisionase family DNA binding protein
MNKKVSTQHDADCARIKVCARKIDVAEKTFRRWVAEGKVAHIRYGRSIRIPLSELNRLAAEGHRPARSAS